MPTQLLVGPYAPSGKKMNVAMLEPSRTVGAA